MIIAHAVRQCRATAGESLIINDYFFRCSHNFQLHVRTNVLMAGHLERDTTIRQKRALLRKES
jgi:hypothetical protein